MCFHDFFEWDSSGCFWCSVSACSRLVKCSGGLLLEHSAPSEATTVACSRGTSRWRPKHRLTSISVDNFDKKLGAMGKFDLPTWGCWPNIRSLGVCPAISLCIWVLHCYWLNGRECAQCIDLFSCIHFLPFPQQLNSSFQCHRLTQSDMAYWWPVLSPSTVFFISAMTPVQD